MLISKFDLYKTEWLDLVFDNRNKAYGAYDLRQNYASNMIRSMAITFLGVGLLIGAAIAFNSTQPLERRTVVDIAPPITPVLPPPVKAIKRPDPPAPVKPVKALPPSPPVATTRLVTLVVKPDNTITEQPPKNVDITGAVGQTTSTGVKGTNEGPPVSTTAGTGTPAVDNSVHPDFGLDVMPEPIGGDKAWAKFLSKNLRYPGQAQEDGIDGKVIVSFIIEKDGTLSNITVIKPAGNGFDEEAVRVLKLAKAWKPGMQNGQAVRVKYMLPVNFQVNTDDK
ncbi:TonB family protein [Mucilaginibacter sp.]|uniref:energy transducer TonB n=1 Tax=Mucilaginibacter sp. TaxID=1882438 RepID=UPI00284B2859|nr:TonB family protein [Mucilaginibacter sp.]MDR3695858.1 TonB family protein [Mucilaginibacter sp.]